MAVSMHEPQSNKRKRTPRYYDLHTFAEPGCPISFSGRPFRDNIRFFLQECAELEDYYNGEGMPVWCTFLVHPTRGFVVPLYTIEETVKHSLKPFCDHCQCAGWNHHFVSKRKYHMIIPVDDEWHRPLIDGVFDVKTHLLHGLIHCNGFGHLVCINGIEGGSKNLYGREIMDLWDRICTTLRTRAITVEDVSKKRLMELRLLHGVAYGYPWFGRWGYRFSHGTFGVTEHNYERAIEILSSMELDTIIDDFESKNRCRNIKQIIHSYRNLSETNLITTRDLLRFMLKFHSRAMPWGKSLLAVNMTKSSMKTCLQNKPMGKEKPVKCKKFSKVAANLDSRWHVRRLEYTANVIVDALKEHKAENKYGKGTMTRQEVRDAARLHIGDTGLIDYVLKSMNNVIVGSYIVRRVVNRSTRVLEFSIEEVGNGVQDYAETEKVHKSVAFFSSGNIVPEDDVQSDVSYFYANVLLDYPESEFVNMAVGTILNSKHFVKKWSFKDEDDEYLRFICRAILNSADLEAETRRELPPGEYVTVPLYATIGDLKAAVQTAMRDTYCIAERFVVTEIDGLEELEDEDVLFGEVESGTEIRVRGLGMEMGIELKYEGGKDNWMVKCKCGACDYDGERMVACDICDVWQHSRCSGIEDSEAVPALFVCSMCCASLVPPRTWPDVEFQISGPSFLPAMTEYDMELLY